MKIKTQKFDCGTKWGVAIETEDGQRHAIRVPGNVSEAEAIELAMPVLLEWAAA